MLDSQMEEFKKHSVGELLRIYAQVLDELRLRGIVRSSNSPTGDYAELLFATAFGWTLQSNSSAGHDAVDANGVRFQIKCRRLTKNNRSRQVSALRKLDRTPFDFLAAVLLDENFVVLRAALIPLELVRLHSTDTPHTNARRFLLRDSIWSIAGVEDVTEKLRPAEQSLRR